MMRFGWQVFALSFASVTRLPALALVGGSPLTAPLKLAVQHLRTLGAHLARRALQSVFMGTMRTQTANARFVKRQWARCGTDVTSAPHLRNSDVATVKSSTWTNGPPHATVGVCRNALDTAHAGGHLVRARRPPPIGHEHSVWDLNPASGELDAQGFGDGSLRNGRMKRFARGEWDLDDMKVTAKLHGPLPGLRQGTCCPGCWWCSNGKEEGTHVKSSRTHTLAKTAHVWGLLEVRGFHTAERVQRACWTVRRGAFASRTFGSRCIFFSFCRVEELGDGFGCVIFARLLTS